MTKNAHIVVMESATGNIVNRLSLHLKIDSIAISMYHSRQVQSVGKKVHFLLYLWIVVENSHFADGRNFIPEMSSKKQSLNSP